MTENYLTHLSQLVSTDELKTMRSLKELKPYLPWEVAGLTVRWEDSVEADTAASRMGAFTTFSNTPATQIMTRPYDPRDIAGLAERTIDRNYDPELREWEGAFNDILKPRGGRNPFHLLEQAIQMGPKGSPEKRGPAPIPWDVFYEAVDELIGTLKDRIGGGLQAKHLVIATPGSPNATLQVAHVMNNSSGNPYFSDPKAGKTAKAYHIPAAIRSAAKYLVGAIKSLPLWRFLVFARGDRAADFDLFLDCEASRDKAIFGKRDRKIDAQSYNLQLLDGIFTQQLATMIAEGPVPEIDLRDPTLLANHFQAGAGIVSQLGESCYSIGRDESAWDQHVTPQGWYACYLVYKALFAPRQSILVFESEYALKIEQNQLDALADLAEGQSRTVTDILNVKGEDQFYEPVTITRVSFDTDPILRRMFAGASGTGAQLGNIVIDGYKEVLDTPRDGKIQLGWSMRSGNYCTFLGNCIINWHKTIAIEKMTRHDESRELYKSEFGYEPPEMSLAWVVIRGDDAGDVWDVPDMKDWKISELVANWLTLTGASANAKKQDTSDLRGRWRLGFAQLFTSENFPRGVSSAVRVLERTVWNEADEVVTVDPDSGEDLRPVLLLMNTYGRINNLWGVWSRDVHPRAEEISSLIQDLDENRILPPLDEEERLKAARAWALKLLRRGQISSGQIDNAIRHFWTTDLPQFALKRYDNTPKLHDRTWAPIRRYGDDAREHWRKC